MITDLDRACARLGRRCTHGIHFNGLTLPQSPAIAQWRERDALRVWKHVDGTPYGWAAVETATARSTLTLWTGKEWSIPAGDLIVRAWFGEPAFWGAMFSDLLRQKQPGQIIWFRVFQETAGLADFLQRHGARWVGGQVMAMSELLGWYCVPARERPIAASEFRTLALLLQEFWGSAQRALVLAEVRAYIENDGGWANHYSKYNIRDSWSGFTLQGYDREDPNFIIKPDEMSASWRREHREYDKAICERTIIADRFPATWEGLRDLKCDFDRVRFLRVRAGDGALGRHADITNRDAGSVEGKLARLHIPLTTSASCHFSAWNIFGARLEAHLPAGSLWYLDQRKPHAVSNIGGSERIHLVVDAKVTPALRALIEGGTDAEVSVGTTSGS